MTSRGGSDGRSNEYRVAYDKIEQGVALLQGLVRTAYELAMDHPVMGSSDPYCSDVVALLIVMEENDQAICDMHEFEWLEVVGLPVLKAGLTSADAKGGSDGGIYRVPSWI